jgi:alpha-glucan,water dikinase
LGASQSSPQILLNRPDLRLAVEIRQTNPGLELAFRLRSTATCLLHWGLARRQPDAWQLPPHATWPPNSHPFDTQALRTPFTPTTDTHQHQIVLLLPPGLDATFLVFDLYRPDTKRWENNHGRDFYIPIPGLTTASPRSDPAQTLDAELANSDVTFRHNFTLDSGDQLAAAVLSTPSGHQIRLFTDAASPVFLHWGILKNGRPPWQLPPESIRPANTTVFDAVAVQTPFTQNHPLQHLAWDLPKTASPTAIAFVLYQPNGRRWLKHRAQDLVLPVAAPLPTSSANPLDPITDRIVAAETGPHGWTLMHRFQLAFDLIADAADHRETWATLFVWLRFSALRQLDWQRNYNTKPRELAHAQDRLTERLATAFRDHPAIRDLARDTLACLGRGGDGQRIRDEILQIMHRHHIKEIGGSWMEQWHQKLHNNTTPDDIVICEAYLAFLQANGDLRRYDETLLAGGVTRQRLATLERPINRDPEWHPHLKEGLLHDFGHYLGLLKSVHSGTDLSTAINAASHYVDPPTLDSLHWLVHNFQNPHVPLTDIVACITHRRRQIHHRLTHESNPAILKELIYLDLALEQTLRTTLERSLHPGVDNPLLSALIGLLIENLLCITTPDANPANPAPPSPTAELAQCQREWQRLPTANPIDPDSALHAKAALDRLRRTIESSIDSTYRLLQPRAQTLGQAFHTDAWVINLFSEEVVRGQAVFLLSLLIHHLDPILRRHAALGDWQVVSPSHAVGEIQVCDSLRSVQGQRFNRPTILLANKVHGDEEPPDGVRAVITPSSVDLVSHIAVRARNASLLFATCYDRTLFESLQALRGQVVEFKPGPTGDLLWTESTLQPCPPRPLAQALSPVHQPPPNPALTALTRTDFTRNRVGGKSWHIHHLATLLPDWIQTPNSVALPFGTLDAVLADPANAPVAARYRQLTAAVLAPLDLSDLSDPSDASEPSPLSPASSHLAQIRACLLAIELPTALCASLQTALLKADLASWANHLFIPTASTPILSPDGPGAAAARCIKQVWASKWNDRAFFSRQARGFPHDAVHMAVLIQPIIDAEFAFVIHTVNPFSGNPAELYAEIVLGLGETLVGNYPGRALSFTCPKSGGPPKILSYPAKSTGLFGGSLIFRSDSNAEDLADYAGAGLYDSVTLEPPREQTLDYTACRLVWDTAFRDNLLRQITQIGILLEQTLGAPQDIEGAFAQNRFHLLQTRTQVGL